MRVFAIALLLGLLPDCQQCGQRAMTKKPTAMSLDESAAGRPTAPDRDYYAETAMTRKTKDRDVGLTVEPPSVRAYPGAERVVLPKPHPHATVTLGQALSGDAPEASVSAPDLQAISDLLFYGYGETGGAGGLRAPASAGALYPGDVFLSVHRANGLAQGVYYYDPRRHDLVRLSATAATTGDNAAIRLLLAADYHRTAYKYGNRAPRYVALDVGHLAANLILVSRAAGYGCRISSEFDARAIGEQLKLTSDQDGVLMVLDCGTDQNPKALSATKPGLARELFEVMGSRRSHRRYLDQPVARQDLETLASAFGALQSAPQVRTWVFVRSVSEMQQGLYAYHPARAQFELVRSGDLSSKLADAGLGQSFLAQAAYVVAWTMADNAEFAPVCLQTGIMGELGYLVATAQHLGVCGVGAFYDDELAKLFGDPPQRPLYLLAVGPRR